MGELPLGFRFYPTEEELISFYLHNKLEGRGQELQRVIPDISIYDIEPWDLPQLSGELCQGDNEQWFFFTPRQEREARGGRPKRTTASGYWKATGSPGYVYSSDRRVIGLKKTMVFYTGKAPSGSKTKWKMNEYRAIEVHESSSNATPELRHEFSLCRVYVISAGFSAFDRRPLEAVTSETKLLGDAATTSAAQDPSTGKITKSSPETSYSGGDHVDHPGTAASAIWGPVDGPEPPAWEWPGQLDWPSRFLAILIAERRKSNQTNHEREPESIELGRGREEKLPFLVDHSVYSGGIGRLAACWVFPCHQKRTDRSL